MISRERLATGADLFGAPVGVVLALGLLAGSLGSAWARPLDVRRLRPYLNTGQGREARAALRAERYADAARLLKRHLAGAKAQRQQARFLYAYALLKQRKWRAAAKRFRRLARSYPLLRDYCRFYAAVALYRTGNFSGSLRLARLVSADSGASLDASLLRAEALHALGRFRESTEIWQSYLEEHETGSRRAEAHYYIALALIREANEARGDKRTNLRKRAIAQLKKIVVSWPLSSWRSKAAPKLRQLARSVEGGKQQIALDPTEIYEQSLVLYQNMRNVASEKGFERALQLDLPAELRCKACYYRAHSAYKQRQRVRAAALFSPCVASCKSVGDTLLSVKSLYNMARGLRFKRKYEQAISRFRQIESDFPQHSYADDARLLTAEILARMGRTREVEQTLSSLPLKYPDGDMAAEALWRLAFQAYLAGRLRQSLAQLDRALALGRATVYYAAGRALYWKARIQDRLGRRSQARKNYEQAVRDHPLSYYALMAFNRLRERHATRYRALHRELIRPVGRQAGYWTIPRGELTRSKPFRRGVELARLGFAASAGRELSRAGLSVNRGQSNERLWLAAVLYDRAQLWHLSHSVPRYRDRRYSKSYPLRENVRRWLLAYPRAFDPFVRRFSRRASISAHLALAVMREESAFRPRVESHANAIGLMQLILPTARAAGKHHGITVSRKTLRDPATNVRLGTTYLAFLQRSFGNLAPLAIAGYNAGHGAVYRWLKQFRANALDELIERIPYDQTRRYTKRVLASLFAYHTLYERNSARRVPRIGQRVPRLKKIPVFAAKTKKRRKRRRK